MPTKKFLVYPITIPTSEIKDAVKKGLLDNMLDEYLKMARAAILTTIEDKYV